MARTRAVLLTLAAALAGPALAAGPDALAGLARVLPERTGPPGRTLPWSTSVKVQPALSPALRAAWEKQLLALAAVLRKAPVLAHPRGFHLQLKGSLQGRAGSAPPRPLTGTLTVWAWPLDRLAAGRAGPARLRTEPPVPALELRLDEPPAPGTFRGLDWMEDAQGAFFASRPEAEVQGFPVFDGELWVSPPGAGPFRPVSRGRVIEAFLAAHPRPTGSTARLAARYAALRDAVSPEALAGPAWLSDDPLEPALVQPDVPGARPVLELNPEALVAAASRTRLHLVRIPGLEALAGAAAEGADPALRVYLEALQQVDWKAVAALLSPPAAR